MFKHVTISVIIVLLVSVSSAYAEKSTCRSDARAHAQNNISCCQGFFENKGVTPYIHWKNGGF